MVRDDGTVFGIGHRAFNGEIISGLRYCSIQALRLMERAYLGLVVVEGEPQQREQHHPVEQQPPHGTLGKLLDHFDFMFFL